jgi:hypothetical protein
MQLIYVTHNSLSHLHSIAPWASWAILIGAVYGLVRLVIDLGRVTGLWRLIRRIPL